MKKIIIFFIFFISSNTFSQSNNLDIQYSPNGFFDAVSDRFGNSYKMEELIVNEETVYNSTNYKSTLLCSSGIFDLYFEDGSGMEDNSTTINTLRRNVICQLFQNISNFLITPLKDSGNTTRVKIWIRKINNLNNIPSNVLGVGTGFYTVPNNTTPGFGGIVDNEIWKTIHAGKDSYTNTALPLSITAESLNNGGSFYHGMLAFNFNNGIWHTDLSSNPPANAYDFYSIALHEITHALGFNSLINHDGTSQLGNGKRYFTRFDKQLINNSNSSHIITTNSGCSLYNHSFNNSLNQNVLHPDPSNCIADNTNCSQAIHFVGINTIPVYTPNCFENGSSFSHFEEVCLNPTYPNNSYFCMSNASVLGNSKRYLKREEKNALIDIGYNLNTTYGNNSVVLNSYYNYVSNINGINVAGVNDGINSSGQYLHNINVNQIKTFSSNTTISGVPGFLLNDYNASSYEYVEDVFDQNSTIVNGTSSFTFKSPNAGVHLLRYVPISSNGKRGNITYIYVYVQNNSSCATPTSACEYVLNGGFEQNSQIPSSLGNIHRACNWRGVNAASPDYFFSGGTNGTNVPCNSMGYQTTNASNNNGYVHMVNRNQDGYQYSESIKSKLKSPLLPNKTYQLSFDVSLAESNSSFSNKLQAYLSTNEIATLATAGDIPVSNFNMLFTSQNFLKNTNNWEKVLFEFTTTTGGEEYIYLGGLYQVQIESSTPAGQNVGGCNYYDYNSTGWLQSRKAGYYIDNVSLVEKEANIDFNLPNTICINSSIQNLNEYLNSPYTNGVFTGNGVQLNSGIYSFNPSTVGEFSINYSYTNNIGCIINVIKLITVLPANHIDCNNCLPNIVLSNLETNTPTVYNVSNNITTETNYQLNSGFTSTLKSGNTIVLKPNSHIKNGAVFLAILEDCNGNQLVTRSETIVSKPINYISFNQTFDYPEIIEAKNTTEVEEEESNSEIKGLKMYPNPVKNNLFIETTLNSDINVSIVNMLGKEVVNTKVVSNIVNVSNLTSGIYIVKITEEGKTSTKKLIIE